MSEGRRGTSLAPGAEARLREVVAVFLYGLDHGIEGRGCRRHVLTTRATVTVAAGAGSTVAVTATETTTVSAAISPTAATVSAAIPTGTRATGWPAGLRVGGIEGGIQITSRRIDTALAVDLGDTHPDRVADLEVLLRTTRGWIGELADMDERIFSTR